MLNANGFFNKNKVLKPHNRYGIGGISVNRPMSIFMPCRVKRLPQAKILLTIISATVIPDSRSKLRYKQLWVRQVTLPQAPTVSAIPVYQPGF